MTQVSEGFWAQLVQAYDRAEAAAAEAQPAADAAMLAANDIGETEAERRYEALREEAYKLEDKLLGVEPPHNAAAALQLRLFALRHHGADIGEPPTPREEPGAAVLRRIYGRLNAV